MKDLKKYIGESLLNESHILGGFPVDKIKNCLEKEYRCKINVDVDDDCVVFSSEDTDMPLFFTIERKRGIIRCPQGIKDCLVDVLGFDDTEDNFEVF